MIPIAIGNVFKTYIAGRQASVKTEIQAKKLNPHIDKILPKAECNFDFEDCDKILRIDSEENIVLKITGLLNKHKFNCEELQ